MSRKEKHQLHRDFRTAYEWMINSSFLSRSMILGEFPFLLYIRRTRNSFFSCLERHQETDKIKNGRYAYIYQFINMVEKTKRIYSEGNTVLGRQMRADRRSIMNGKIDLVCIHTHICCKFCCRNKKITPRL